MRYSEEFKNMVIEDFITCPFYKTICAKYKIERGTIKSWVKKKELNVAELVHKYESRNNEEILLSKFIKISIA